MARSLLVFLVLAGSLAMAACNTVRGVGQDLESAANAVDEVDD